MPQLLGASDQEEIEQGLYNIDYSIFVPTPISFVSMGLQTNPGLLGAALPFYARKGIMEAHGGHLGAGAVLIRNDHRFYSASAE